MCVCIYRYIYKREIEQCRTGKTLVNTKNSPLVSAVSVLKGYIVFMISKINATLLFDIT